MKFITVNPTWHVPPSIINREYLPAMAQDPGVMQRMGLVVQRDNSGKVIGIYQPPGDRNAEGRLRFNFPNKFIVYQHDTPDKYMFAYARRAFSHGCMRTQDPAKYAEVLLSLVRPNDHYTKERIEHMYGPNEINIDFPTFMPINVTYQTAFVDDDGKLQFRDDIYGRDRELLAIMHNPERNEDCRHSGGASDFGHQARNHERCRSCADLRQSLRGRIQAAARLAFSSSCSGRLQPAAAAQSGRRRKVSRTYQAGSNPRRPTGRAASPHGLGLDQPGSASSPGCGRKWRHQPRQSGFAAAHGSPARRATSLWAAGQSWPDFATLPGYPYCVGGGVTVNFSFTLPKLTMR